MSTRNSFFACIFLFITFITTSIAQTTCVPSSCGDIREIKFPFRLTSDPQHCGKPGYELDCQNNQTVFNYKSRKFKVQEINYTNLSVRLLDPSLKNHKENCTVFPNYRASYGAMTSQIFGWLPVDNSINYVNCRGPINSSRYIPTRFCNTNTTSPNISYIVIGEILVASDLAGGCRVENVAWSAAPGISKNNTSSLTSIHQALSYGFELSWRLDFLCRECNGRENYCNFEDNNNEVPICRHYCKEDTPLSQRSFKCKLDYYSVFVLAYGSIAIGAIIVLKFLVGIPILIAVVVWQCKRRNLNTCNDNDLGDKASSSEQNC